MFLVIGSDVNILEWYIVPTWMWYSIYGGNWIFRRWQTQRLELITENESDIEEEVSNWLVISKRFEWCKPKKIVPLGVDKKRQYILMLCCLITFRYYCVFSFYRVLRKKKNSFKYRSTRFRHNYVPKSSCLFLEKDKLKENHL